MTIRGNRFNAILLAASSLLFCFSALCSEGEARQHCEQRQDYVDPERGESCGIYEHGLSTASTVDHPTRYEISAAQQEAITKSRDRIYGKLLGLAQRWSKVDFSPGEREEVLSSFRRHIAVESEYRPCERRGGKNRHFCAARSRLFLSDNSAKVEEIMNRLIALKSHAQGNGAALSRPARYLEAAYNNKLNLFSDTFSFKKTIRTGESIFSIYTMELYYTKEEEDTRKEFLLQNPGALNEMSAGDAGHAHGHEIVVVMRYPVQYADISDELHMKYHDTIEYDSAQLTEINEHAFTLHNSADEPLPGNLAEKQWVPFKKIKYHFPNQFVHWLTESGHYKDYVLVIDIREDDFFDAYYVRKRIRLVNACDKTGGLTRNVQIRSNDFFIPDVIAPDAEGYYSISLPKRKWNDSCTVSVSTPEFREKTISLDPFYKEAPLNTKNDISLVPDRRRVTFEIMKSADVTENAFHLTYQVDSERAMRLNPYFMDTASYTEVLSVPGGMDIDSFAIQNTEGYRVNLVHHEQGPEPTCDELIRLQIERVSD